MLQNQFTGQLREEMVQKLLREKIQNNPDLTLLKTRNLNFAWYEPDRMSESLGHLLHDSETVSARKKKEAEKRESLSDIRDSLKKLETDSDRFSE